MTIERVELTPEQYWETVERARVLSRLVAKDPSDLDARLSLALLRRDGFDVEDPAWVLGFTPREPEPASVPIREETGDEWVERAIIESRGFAAVGLVDRAIDLLETVLRMQPENDRARAFLFELEMRRLAAATGSSADDTLRIRPR